MLNRLCQAIAFIFLALQMQAQSDPAEQSDSLVQLPAAYLDKVSSRAGQLEGKLDKKSEKIFQRMMKREAKMKKKLARIDSSAAVEIFNNTSQKYQQIKQRLASPNGLTQYFPKLDTLSTSLKFIENNPQLLSSIKNGKEKLKEAMSKMNGLEDQFKKAEDIKQFLRERKRFLKEQLSKFGFARELKKMNKEIYYYSQQVNEYREMLKDSKKIESKALALLSKTKLFRDFMKRNSMLASFFPMPGGPGGNASPQGVGFAALQTRAQVTGFLQQAGFNASNGISQLRKNIQDAGSQLDQLRSRMSQTGGDGLDMPDFKPNAQKTKSFFKRLEYGTTLQSQKANGFFPVTSDLGLSVGYKLNDKSVIGIGASYKVGLGSGWKNIKLSNEGVGLKSFIDWKIKGSFWMTGGYEQNYRTVFNSIDQLKDFNAWQQSGLVGVSKIVSLKTKFLKKTRVQLLWDFLSYNQRPVTQPVLFRIGYNF